LKKVSGYIVFNMKEDILEQLVAVGLVVTMFTKKSDNQNVNLQTYGKFS